MPCCLTARVPAANSRYVKFAMLTARPCASSHTWKRERLHCKWNKRLRSGVNWSEGSLRSATRRPYARPPRNPAAVGADPLGAQTAVLSDDVRHRLGGGLAAAAGRAG